MVASATKTKKLHSTRQDDQRGETVLGQARQACSQHGSAAGNQPRQRALKGGVPSGLPTALETAARNENYGYTTPDNGGEDVPVYRQDHGSDRSAYLDERREVGYETEYDSRNGGCKGVSYNGARYDYDCSRWYDRSRGDWRGDREWRVYNNGHWYGSHVVSPFGERYDASEPWRNWTPRREDVSPPEDRHVASEPWRNWTPRREE